MAGITFDKSVRYKDSKGKEYGKGVWRRPNGDIIPVRNRIKNSDGSYLLLNPDGTSTKLYENGKFTRMGTALLSAREKADIQQGKIFSRLSKPAKLKPKTMDQLVDLYGAKRPLVKPLTSIQSANYTKNNTKNNTTKQKVDFNSVILKYVPEPVQQPKKHFLLEFVEFNNLAIGPGPSVTYGLVKDKIVKEAVKRANNNINYYLNIDQVVKDIDKSIKNEADKLKVAYYTSLSLDSSLKENAKNDLYNIIYDNVYNRTKDNHMAAKIAGEQVFGETYASNPSSSYFSLGGSPSASRVYAIADAKRLGGITQGAVFNKKQTELEDQYYKSPEFINAIDLIALKNGLTVSQVLELLPEKFLSISKQALTDQYLPTNSTDFILTGLARGLNSATYSDLYTPDYEKEARSSAIKETKEGNNPNYIPNTLEKGAYTTANVLPIVPEVALAFYNPEATLMNGVKYFTKSQIKLLPRRVVTLGKNFSKDAKGLYKEFIVDPKGLTRNVMKSGIRKVPELGGDIGGFMLANSLIERVDDENIRKYGGLAMTGTLMGVGRSAGQGFGKIIMPTNKGFLKNIAKQGVKSPYVKDAEYAVANNILNNLRFGGAYIVADNLIDSDSYAGEVGKFGLASGLTGLSNWATNRAFNNMLTNAIKDYERRILELNAPLLAELRIIRLQNLDRAINGVDNKINTTPVVTRKSVSSILNNQELTAGQKTKQLLLHNTGPASRYFANGTAQGSLGVLNMGLIDYAAPEQLKDNPYYEYAKMNLGNRLGNLMMNTLGYGFRSGSGGETSLSRVTERLSSAASRDKARIMLYSNIPLTLLKFGSRNNRWANMLDRQIEANNLRLANSYKNWTEFTGSQVKVGNLTGYQIKHDNRRKDIEYLKKHYPKMYELLKNGYSTGEFDYTAMDNNGFQYLGTALEGYGMSLGENATPREIALSLSGYAGKRHGSLYRNFITDLGLKDLKGFNYKEAEVPIFSRNSEGVMTMEKVPLYIKIGERYYPNPRVKNAAIGERLNDFNITNPFKGPKDKNGNRKEWVIQSNVAGHINVPVFNNGPEGTKFTNVKFDTGGYGQTTESYNSGTSILTTLPGKLLDDNSARLHIMTADNNPNLISAYSTLGSVPRLTYKLFIATALRLPKLLRNSFIELQIASFGINPKTKAILKKQEANRNRELVSLINLMYPLLQSPITAVGGNGKSRVSTNYTAGMHKLHIKRMLGALPKSENPEVKAQVEKLSKEYELIFDADFNIIPERWLKFLQHLREFYQKEIDNSEKSAKKKRKGRRKRTKRASKKLYGGKLIPKAKSGIHIKKENRGKFTSYCGGKVTDACIKKAKASGNPTLVKRATFAENARKWKH